MSPGLPASKAHIPFTSSCHQPFIGMMVTVHYHYHYQWLIVEDSSRSFKTPSASSMEEELSPPACFPVAPPPPLLGEGRARLTLPVLERAQLAGGPETLPMFLGKPYRPRGYLRREN